MTDHPSGPVMTRFIWPVVAGIALGIALIFAKVALEKEWPLRSGPSARNDWREDDDGIAPPDPWTLQGSRLNAYFDYLDQTGTGP